MQAKNILSFVLMASIVIQAQHEFNFIKPFNQIGLDDIMSVGGKNASLGQMISHLSKQGIRIPNGFAITADAYWHFLQENKLDKVIKQLIKQCTHADLHSVANKIRTMIINAKVPTLLSHEITDAYRNLCAMYGNEQLDVAVRSSGTAEDLPNASFAGQQDTYLNVRGADAILHNYKKCIASLFNERAILYRIEQGFDSFDVALSVGIQKMVRSDLACSGVAFSLDTESGFAETITINGSYGLGEMVVQGTVTPDEFRVYKPTLKQNFNAIINKTLGNKTVQMIYEGTNKGVKEIEVPELDQQLFCLTDDEILYLAEMICKIEEHYSHLYDRWTPMDIEWAKDGIDGNIYIVQARPETVHAQRKQNGNLLTTYRLNPDKKLTNIVSGQSVGQHIVSGIAHVIDDIDQADLLKEGEILVTSMTDPDWVPAMKKASGIITNHGGRTCHAAIVSRELGVPALVGTGNATQKIHTGDLITLDCSQGHVGLVYAGAIPFQKEEIYLETLPELPVKVMVNIAEPSNAFNTAMLPVAGVGLARVEFIINNAIKAHPMAFIHPERIDNPKVIQEINSLCAAYDNPKEFFVSSLAQGVATIAAAFYPRPVIVRMSDFKSNEYGHLLGGSYFEPKEENPMIGFRGASRYYDPAYQEAFGLECQAMKRVRNDMGLTNVKLMLPFVRTLKEAEKTIAVMEQHGLKRGQDDLELIMMCEIPSNVICIDEFCNYFDGFSIGSNDLTQLTLGVDRDSAMLLHLFDERDLAVKRMLKMAIEGALRNNKYIGICGQGPSDHPEIAQFLTECGIHSLSLNADTVMPFIMRHTKNR
jgi:pyruvate,water dikinase